ncbi:MAG: hypothetical protein FJ206_07410 [Gemmatimonadetes bacterium]|nr:hypothetical protein [Gemmatimonadota bacterium]
MRPLVTLAILTLPAAQLAAQPSLPASGAAPSAFVPEGYRILRELAGHLNGDEYRDAVLILADAREAPDTIVEDPLPRILVVLTGSRGGFRLAVVNDRAVLGRLDGGAFGDPLDELSLDRNVIVLSPYGGSAWRWRFTHRFRFHADRFELIGRTTASYFNAAYCDRLGEYRPTTHIDENLLTGERVRYQVPESRCVKRTRRSRFQPVRPSLAEFDIRKDTEGR